MIAPSSLRAVLVLVILGVVLAGLGGRVAFLQSKGSVQNVPRAKRQQFQSEPLFARRGSVFDRNGLLMAGTVQSQSLFVDPKFMAEQFAAEGRDPYLATDDAAARLAGIVGRDAFEVAKVLSDKSGSRFVRIADNLDEAAIARIETLDLPGIGFTPFNVRYYPMGSVAAHVLGGVGAEGNGLEGIELKFNKILAGKDGTKRTLKDARRRPLFVDADDYRPADHGQQVVLTIDASIQTLVEQQLAETCEKFRAKTAEAVVIDPFTGDVLALANYPTFNPQQINETPAGTRRNRAVVDPYEPGSTIKPFIVGPALQKQVTRWDEIFPTNGDRWPAGYGGRVVRDVHGYAKLALWDVLVKSSNIGMCMLGQRMGNPGLFAALTGFKFGQRTGIELPGEDPGLVNPLKKWNRFTTESISQGYEMRVTPLQLARGMCAYANGGRLIDPRIVQGTLDDGGRVANLVPRKPFSACPPVIDPATSAQVRRILCDVMIRGTASRARSGIYNLFGKTGTAHSAVNGAYNEENYTSSFIGGGPFENPRLVVAVVIHNPDKSLAHFGGTVAAPAATAILDQALQYLQVPASGDLPLPPPNVANLLYAYDAKQYGKPTPVTASVQE